MKTPFALSVIILFFGLFACQKDESALNDYDLFGRLQFGGGTWELTASVSFDNSDPNPTYTTTNPTDQVVYHFFMRSIEVSGSIVDVPTVAIYQGQNLNQIYKIDAEYERVVFWKNEIFDGTAYTVLSNKYNEQIWQITSGSLTTQITLERCHCTFPIPGSSESGG